MINVLENLVFFIGNYDFEDLEFKYIDVFNESLKQLSLDYIKSRIETKNQPSKIERRSFTLNDNSIEMEFRDKTFTIENLEEFSFEALIFFLSKKDDLYPISKFELIKLLKIQYLDKFINEKILTKKRKNFFYRVFSSSTIYDLISKVYKHGIIILYQIN